MYHILLAVSSDHESVPGNLVDTVIGLPSAADEVEVTLLNVFEAFDVRDEGGGVSSKDLYDEDDLPDVVGAVRERLRDAGIPVTLRREHGDPAAEILAVAAELDVDAIALQGRKHSPIGKALFGSVAQAVLLDADQPVIVSAPEA